MKNFDRRKLLLTGVAALAAPYLMPSTAAAETLTRDMVTANRRNISSFRTHKWEDHFEDLTTGAILADLTSRSLQFWSSDGKTSKIFPTSVPMSNELTRLGYTKVIRKVEGPTWTPTPSMRERFPDWPPVIPAGPENPLGTHALYLTWQYYRIHGTHDTRKIGRRSSDGCVGLYNFHIAELYEMSDVGVPVKLIS